MKYILNETDLLNCLGRLFVPMDGRPHHSELKWVSEDNVLTVTFEVSPPKDDVKSPVVLDHTFLASLKKVE